MRPLCDRQLKDRGQTSRLVLLARLVVKPAPFDPKSKCAAKWKSLRLSTQFSPQAGQSRTPSQALGGAECIVPCLNLAHKQRQVGLP